MNEMCAETFEKYFGGKPTPARIIAIAELLEAARSAMESAAKSGKVDETRLAVWRRTAEAVETVFGANEDVYAGGWSNRQFRRLFCAVGEDAVQ